MQFPSAEVATMVKAIKAVAAKSGEVNYCYFCGRPCRSTFCQGHDASLKSEIFKMFGSVIALAKAVGRGPATPITSGRPDIAATPSEPAESTVPAPSEPTIDDARAEAIEIDHELAREVAEEPLPSAPGSSVDAIDRVARRALRKAKEATEAKRSAPSSRDLPVSRPGRGRKGRHG